MQWNVRSLVSHLPYLSEDLLGESDESLLLLFLAECLSASSDMRLVIGILMYVYGQLEEQELGINDKSKNVENKHFEIGPKPKNR